MKIFVAIPGRGHALDFGVTKCLIEEYAISLRVGVDIQLEYFPSSGGIADGRNFLASSFMNSDCDKMVFLDSDITFEPGALISLALKPVDFVAGCYRHKKIGESYPVDFKEGEMWADKNKLIKVEKVPFGFVSLSREVFKKFDAKYPERINKNFGLKSTAYFQLPIDENGILWGEDFQFCKEWNAMGETVFVDPEVELTHWGMAPVPYKGRMGDWLKKQPHNVEAYNKKLGVTNGSSREKGSEEISSVDRGCVSIPIIEDINLSNLRVP